MLKETVATPVNKERVLFNVKVSQFSLDNCRDTDIRLIHDKGQVRLEKKPVQGGDFPHRAEIKIRTYL